MEVGDPCFHHPLPCAVRVNAGQGSTRAEHQRLCGKRLAAREMLDRGAERPARCSVEASKVHAAVYREQDVVVWLAAYRNSGLEDGAEDRELEEGVESHVLSSARTRAVWRHGGGLRVFGEVPWLARVVRISCSKGLTKNWTHCRRLSTIVDTCGVGGGTAIYFPRESVRRGVARRAPGLLPKRHRFCG